VSEQRPSDGADFPSNREAPFDAGFAALGTELSHSYEAPSREGSESLSVPRPFPPEAWILHIGLLFVTFVTSTTFGSALAESFDTGSFLTEEALINSYRRLLHFDHRLWSGLAFSVPLLIVLLAHELGHFLECRRRQVDASLPYFLPSPFPLGTFGAFIRIRSPIYTREDLFDIGIRGPLAGFLALVPFLLIGVWLSRIAPHASTGDPLTFGTPLVLRAVEQLRFPGVPVNRIVLHPMAMAAWVGLFATALNLLPIGQLDGGHILYAVGLQSWHRRISAVLIAMLAVGGFFYWPWWIWGAVMFFFGRRHPLVYDSTPLSKTRLALCFAAFLILVLSATVIPFRGV